MRRERKKKLDGQAREKLPEPPAGSTEAKSRRVRSDGVTQGPARSSEGIKRTVGKRGKTAAFRSNKVFPTKDASNVTLSGQNIPVCPERGLQSPGRS